MSEWWTYRLEDLLLFSPRVYWRMFELHNAALWPLHLPAILAGCVVILLVLARPRRHGFWIALILASVWLFVGWEFLWNRYAGINWAVTYVAPVFGLQALLLIAFGAAGRLTCERLRSRGWPGIGLATLALVAYPATTVLSGRPWDGSEVFGIAPDPTATFTLGTLLAIGGASAIVLSIIPALWLLISGLTLYAMGESQAWAPFGAILFALVLAGIDRLSKSGRPR